MSQFCLRANLCVCGGTTASLHTISHSVYHLDYTSCDTHRFSLSLSHFCFVNLLTTLEVDHYFRGILMDSDFCIESNIDTLNVGPPPV